MRLVILAAATALLAAPMPLAAAPAPAPEYSWGKVGITIDQYRRDAIQCGRKGYYRDVSNTDAAKTFKRATSMLDSNEARVNSMASPDEILSIYVQSAHIVEGTRPEKQMHDVRLYLEEAMVTCLTERGYTRFRLTKSQRARLAKLHLGSPERHAFMFSLASNPEVLAKQAVA